MDKEQLLKAAVEDFLAKHEKEYKDPKAPKDYAPPFVGEPDFLDVKVAPADDPISVTFVLRTGHKHHYEAIPGDAPKAESKPAAARGRPRAEGEAKAEPKG